MTLSRTTLLDFLRHGEPVGGRKYRGHLDDPLSDKGWAEMHAAVGQDVNWTAIVSSPLSRCRAYAEYLANEYDLELTVDERLKEVGFGAWEGRTPAELRRDDPHALFEFRTDPIGRRPSGAEDLQAFYDRVSAAFDDLVADYAGGHVLVVAHAGVIRMAVCRVLHVPLKNAYRLQVGSAAMARFRVEEHHGRRLEQLLYLTPGHGGD